MTTLKRYRLLKGAYRMLDGKVATKGAIIYSNEDLCEKYLNKFLPLDAPPKPAPGEEFDEDSPEFERATKSAASRKEQRETARTASVSKKSTPSLLEEQDEEVNLGEDVTEDYASKDSGIKVYQIGKKYNLHLEGDTSPLNDEPLTAKKLTTKLEELGALG